MTKKKRDPYRLIDGKDFSPIIPDTQQEKILALKAKHPALFCTEIQRFNLRLKDFEPK